MVGELRHFLQNRKKVADGLLFSPSLVSPDLWDRWQISASGLGLLALTPTEQWPKTGLPTGSRLALPTAEVFCLSLWLQELDETKLPAMIALQLEGRGLRPPDQVSGDSCSWVVVDRNESKSLVLVVFLPAQLAPSYLAAQFDAFEAAPRLRDYEVNSLTLWREKGRICLACTRSSALVHFQSLSESDLTASVIRDLDCIISALQLQEVLLPVQKVVLWFEASAEQREQLQKVLQTPVVEAEVSPVRLPTKVWNLQPAQLLQAQIHRQTARWHRQLAIGLGALYGCIFLFYLLRLSLTLLQIEMIHLWQHQNQEVLQQTRATAATWHYLAPVVATADYPLETLLHCASSLPLGSHLNLFEQIDGQVHFQAETRDAAQAFGFLTKLQHEPSLSTYQWVMSQPRLLPNDLAQLQIQGTRADSH